MVLSHRSCRPEAVFAVGRHHNEGCAVGGMRTEADMGNGYLRSIVGKSERKSLRLVRSEILSGKVRPDRPGL